MGFVSVSEFSKKYGLSERTVRNYCASGKLKGAFLTGKTWTIPAECEPPSKTSAIQVKNYLLTALKEQKEKKQNGGIYHKTQIELTYNSNHIEGSRLTHDQTRYIYETNTIGTNESAVKVDDIVETVNHFRCIDMIIDKCADVLSESLIKDIHRTLKSGTSDASLSWFNVGEYKQLPNEIGGNATCLPENVHKEMSALLKSYNAKKTKSFDDILDFHKHFEAIHPFQDGNGRVGRLIMFKECLANNIVPFIITDELKMFYYRGLQNWPEIPGYLRDTCLTAQDIYKQYLDYFRIKY